MPEQPVDIQSLAEALERFTQTTQSMEESYRLLEERIAELDQQLARKNQELAVTTEYLSNLLESISDGVIVVENDGTISRFNRAASVMLGYSAEEVVDKDFKECFEREFMLPPASSEMGLRAKSGRVVPVKERNSRLEGRDGVRMGYVKTFEDLREVAALRKQMRQVDRLAAIGEMAASVAHEIRNPLGAIRGFAAFLANDIPKEDPRRRLVDRIQLGSANLEKVVNELLEYTRPVALNLAPTSCVDIVQSMLHYVNYDADCIEVVNEVDPDFRVLADADKIRQVFMNIFVNAVQSIEKTGSIHLRSEADDTTVLLYFEDTGSGMSAGSLKKMFSPFFTTKEKGTGLGLAVCAKIVEGHGGAISAESMLGKGTTLKVGLPRTE